MPDVAVVLGSYASEHHLAECIGSLRVQSLEPAELLVVDASSPDRSAATAEALGARVLVVPNRGLAYLYNRGVEVTSAPYVLLSNVDVAYHPHCLELLAAALDGDERRFAADARQLDWETGEVVHARTTLRPGRLVREYLPGLHLDHRVEAEGVVPTLNTHGAAMLVRRRCFDELGGFDETFFMDWEDLDLCWRGWLRGWPSVHVADARVQHRGGATTGVRLASSHHNLLRFALKCLPPSAAARVVAGELLRLPRHPRAITRAGIDVAAELPEIVRLRRRIGSGAALLAWMLAGQPDPGPTLG